MAVEIHISVRSLVEFLLRSGDLDNRIMAAPEDAMQEGSRMHRRLQKAQGEDYQAEVPLSLSYTFPGDAGEPGQPGDPDSETLADSTFSVVLDGRADGLYHGSLPDDPSSPRGLVIDEIKTTYRNLARMEVPEPVHLAQARCYAYICCVQQDLPFVYVRMTYVNLDTEDIHYFYERMERAPLEEWFDALMREYRKWALFSLQWIGTRTQSIHALTFPYTYREGQKELAAAVYRTIVHQRKLFLEAPTGTGKTIATLFPSIKAMGEGKADKIFYLTAKTVTSSVAEDTLRTLRTGALRIKSVVLTARDRICVLEKTECNPDACPRAAGHFDRVNGAIYDLLCRADDFDRTAIEQCAEKYQVCPFELSLDLSLFSDVIICDYNYVFDPHAYLRRFFAAGESRGNYLFLVDEAHNLVDRGRDMYSSELSGKELLETAAFVEKRYPGLAEEIRRCARALFAMKAEDGSAGSLLEQNKSLLEQNKSLPGQSVSVPGRAVSVTGGSQYTGAGLCGEHRNFPSLRVWQDGEKQLAGVLDAVNRVYTCLHDFFENERRKARRRKRKLSSAARALQDRLLNFYFDISDFVLIGEMRDEHYCVYTEQAGGDFRLRFFCMDPGENLKLCMSRAVSTILFSATLLPIQYYKQLLGGTPEDYEIYAHSVFDPEKRALLIARDVTSRYARRGEEEYRRIAGAIAGAVSGRHGNYMVFFPSYHFLAEVADLYEGEFCDPAAVTVIRQEPGMDDGARAAFLAKFGRSSDEHSLLGFCVLGGIFSEGIDLQRDSLIGVIIVGTGVPQIGSERELLREYFDGTGVNGYDYAYRFPGMNKVLQAAGRVIRTQDDVGMVVLLDERFLTNSYLRLFPREWTNWKAVDSRELAHQADVFWNEWL